MNKEKFDWWPRNPYPKSVFPMERDKYSEVVPDPDERTTLSGMLGREFWEIASETIWNALQNHLEELELEREEKELSKVDQHKIILNWLLKVEESISEGLDASSFHVIVNQLQSDLENGLKWTKKQR